MGCCLPPPLSDPHRLMSERKLKLFVGSFILLLNQHLIQAGDIIKVLNEMENPEKSEKKNIN